MQVRHYMTAAAAVTHPDEPVVAAARLMRQRSIGALPVCEDDGTLAGMLTDRDIVVRCVSAGDDPQTATVRGIMSRDPVTIEADADVRTAMTAMRAAQVRRLPVTEGGKLAGVLSIDDIARSGKWDMECAQALCGITANVCRRRSGTPRPSPRGGGFDWLRLCSRPSPCAYAQVYFLPAAQTPRGRPFCASPALYRAQIAHKRQNTAQKTQQSAQSRESFAKSTLQTQIPVLS